MPEIPVEAPAIEETVATVTETTETPPEPKKRGRPTGAKDTTKRTRKPVQIRVEPLQEKPEPPVPKPEPIVEPRKPAEPPAEIEEPKTPRTLIKETSRHLISLRALVNDNRKDEMGKRYIQKWSKCPLN